MKLQDARKFAIEQMQEWDLTPKWHFEFDNAKRRFGRCWISRKKITISKHLTKLNDAEQVFDTILHEIAHALDAEERGTSDHSRKWKAWARKIGAKPERCYSTKEVENVYKYFDYCPSCGKKSGRHKRRPKNNLLASCGKCSHGFDDDYMLIFNIPTTKMKQIENGNLDWQQLDQTQAVISQMRMTYSHTSLDDSKFFNNFHNYVKEGNKIAARNPKKKKPKPTMSTVEYLTLLIKTGRQTKEQIVEQATAELNISASTVKTYISDGKNPKYNKFPKLIKESAKGVLSF